MNRFLGPLARYCAARPWRALLLWVVGAAAAFALASTLGAPAQEDWDAPGTQAQAGVDLLRVHLPAAGNASAQVVVHDRREAAVPDAEIADLSDRLAALPHVLAVDPPRVSEDRATVLLTREVRRARHPPRPDGARRAAGGRRSRRPGRAVSRWRSAASCPPRPRPR